MKLLITGGAGFIGSNFVRMICTEYPHEITKVIVLDKLTYSGNLSTLNSLINENRIVFEHGDICDSSLLEKLILEVDAVINFAAESHVDRSINNAESFVQTNIGGVQRILDAIRKVNPKIRFLQISTDEVYGSIETGSWKESSCIAPNSPYSATKASGELIARAYHNTYGLDVVVTRCSNNFGPNQFPEKLIPLFITNILEGKKLPIYGNGTNVRDWLHVDDHCRGILLALNQGESGEIYNIGGGCELSNLQITNLILNLMNESGSLIEFVEDRKGHDFRYSVDCSRMENELGYAPRVNFEDGLKATIEWYKNNRGWWEPLKNRAGL